MTSVPWTTSRAQICQVPNPSSISRLVSITPDHQEITIGCASQSLRVACQQLMLLENLLDALRLQCFRIQATEHLDPQIVGGTFRPELHGQMPIIRLHGMDVAHILEARRTPWIRACEYSQDEILRFWSGETHLTVALHRLLDDKGVVLELSKYQMHWILIRRVFQSDIHMLQPSADIWTTRVIVPTLSGRALFSRRPHGVTLCTALRIWRGRPVYRQRLMILTLSRLVVRPESLIHAWSSDGIT
mmetsp:Transcript_159996/g.295018  ORF Transcript_159996/g.295018 Transcript_159996/m.295018 type:complete len:245 (+) Transcript_159996:1108-1842(+)